MATSETRQDNTENTNFSEYPKDGKQNDVPYSGPNNTDLNGQSKDVKQNDVPCKKNGQHEVKGGEHVAASNQHSKKINNSQQKSISKDINTKETQKEHDKGKKNKSVQNKGKGINNSQNKSTYKDRNKKGSPKEHEEESSKNYNEPKKEKVDRKDRFLPSDGKCSSDHSSEAQRVEEEESFEFFWQKDSPFSQWHISEFTVDGITFNCAEQYMMYSKAMLFGDEETAEEILKEEDPRNHKQWGRQVRNFDQKKWDDNCVDIVKRGNKEKFSQNEKLCRIIKTTYPKTLVEASPYDKIWGIGLKKDDLRAKNKKTWRGKNLLGQALTDVRNELMKEESKSAQNSDISKDAEIQKKDNNVPVVDAQSADKNTDKNTDNSSDSNSILSEPGPHSHVCSNCTLSGDETKNEKEMSTNDNKVDNVDTRNIKKNDPFGKPNETTTSIDQEPVVSVTVKMDVAKVDTCCKQTENEDCASHDPVINDVGNTAVGQFTPDGTTDKMASNTPPLQPAKCAANQERMCSENALNNKPPEKQVDKSNTNQVISENSSGTSESRADHTLTNDENKSSEHEGETTLYENTVEQTGQPDI